MIGVSPVLLARFTGKTFAHTLIFFIAPNFYGGFNNETLIFSPTHLLLFNSTFKIYSFPISDSIPTFLLPLSILSFAIPNFPPFVLKIFLPFIHFSKKQNIELHMPRNPFELPSSITFLFLFSTTTYIFFGSTYFLTCLSRILWGKKSRKTRYTNKVTSHSLSTTTQPMQGASFNLIPNLNSPKPKSLDNKIVRHYKIPHSSPHIAIVTYFKTQQCHIAISTSTLVMSFQINLTTVVIKMLTTIVDNYNIIMHHNIAPKYNSTIV